jgi:hypothetical protein
MIEEPVAWPTWPFTRLTPKEMQKLLKDLEKQKREQAEDAPF